MLNRDRAKRKFDDYINLIKQNNSVLKASGEVTSLTLGDVVVFWAKFTGQDEMEFASRVYPKLSPIVLQYQQTKGQLPMTDSQAMEDPETTFDFFYKLCSILLNETPEDKITSLFRFIDEAMTILAKQPEALDELLQPASVMMTSQTMAKINDVLSADVSAKDRLLTPEYSELIQMEAKKFGLPGGVPEDNRTQLEKHLKQSGISASKRAISRALKKLGRKSPLVNIEDTLEGNLGKNLRDTITEQEKADLGNVQSIWGFSPVSPEDTAETEKRVREWLFRREK